MAYVSLKSIAKKAGVSVASVSVALRNQPGVSPSLGEKIKAIAQGMGYQPVAVLQEAMEQLRTKRPDRFHAQIALCTDLVINDKSDVRHMQWQALKARAALLGYDVEIFVLPKLTWRQLRSALRVRNVRGILLDLNNWLRPDLEFLLQEFACVSLNHLKRLGLPTHFAEPDQYQAGRKVMQEILARGYRRIGFVRAPILDPEGLGRAGVYSMDSKSISLTTIEVGSPQALDKQAFLNWFEAERPDCLLTMIVDVREILREAGYRCPDDIGMAHLYRSKASTDDWCGINAMQDEVNATGLKRLVSMLRQGESGIPQVQECILVQGIWSEGSTLRPARARLVYGVQPRVLDSRRLGSGKLRCLNLHPYVNKSLTLSGGWFGDLALQHCVPGEHEICGTRFRILDESVEGKAALIMRCARDAPGDDAKPVEVNISIGERIRSIHFLHACGWSGGPIRNFAAYHILDARGKGVTLPLVDRRALSGPESDGNIQDYWPHREPLTRRNVRPVHLTEFGNKDLYSAYLYILEWVNPKPQRIVETLRITSNPKAQTALGLLAITVQL